MTLGWAVAIYPNDKDTWPKLLKNEIKFTDIPEFKNIMANYKNLYTKGYINKDNLSATYDMSKEAVVTGKAAMALQGEWFVSDTLAKWPDNNANEGEEHILSSQQLINLLVKLVSHNGNLLINIGPKADGSIPELQKTRLLALGSWLDVNGEAIYGTRPYIRQYERTANDVEVFFTKKNNDLFIILDNLKAGTNEVLVKEIGSASGRASILGGKIRGKFEDAAKGLKITLEGLESSPLAVAVKLSGCL